LGPGHGHGRSVARWGMLRRGYGARG
jgi:hypothetical protein